MELQHPSDGLSQKQCLFCQEMIIYRPGELHNLQTHLRITHEITHNGDFALYALFLIREEMEEMQRRLEPRVKEFMSEKCESPSFQDMNQLEEDKELKDIQANLMDQMEESDSDADDDGGNDKKEVTTEEMNTKTVIKEERGPSDAKKIKSEVKTED